MKRPNIEVIKTTADDVPDFDVYTEEDGLSIKCSSSDRQAIKAYITGADTTIFKLCEYVKVLEKKLAAISAVVNEAE